MPKPHRQIANEYSASVPLQAERVREYSEISISNHYITQ